jgi:PAS domain S-box-containing protein
MEGILSKSAASGLKQLLGFAAAATVAVAIGSLLALPSAHGSAVASVGGLLLAMLLVSEQRTWWRWLAIAVMVDLLSSVGLHGVGVAPAVGDILGHVLGILAAAWCTRRACSTPLRIDSPRHVALLAIFTIIPGAVLSASVDLLVTGVQGESAPGTAWLILCTGYALSGLLVTPLLLAAYQTWIEGVRISMLRGLEAVVATLVLAAVLHVVFSHQRPLIYVTLPIMLWVALRFGTLGMTIALALFAAVATHYSATGLGPYAAYATTERILLVQSFLVLASISGLLLAGVTAERARALGELRQARDALDVQVNERTTALRESEQRLRALIDAIPDQVRVKDAQGRYIMVNRAAQTSFGATEEQIVGKTVFELRPPDAAALIDAEDRQAIATQQVTRIERKSFYFDAWREIITVPIQFAHRVGGLITISRDISERKRTEIALRESEHRQRTLLDAIPDAVRLKDMQGRYLMANRAALANMGRTEAEVIGKTLYDVVPPEIAKRIEAEEQRAIASGRPVVVERDSYVAPDTWQEVILAPISDAAGKLVGLVSISRDISARRRAELEALREREERYRTLVETASDVIYRTDHQGYFTYFNSDHLLRNYGFTREQLIGKHYLELVHPDHRAQTEAYYREQFENRVTSSYHEFPILTGDGRKVWAGQHVNAVIENGRIVYHQAVCRDVTERVMAQHALRDINEKLRQLSARQEALLEAERTRIAHDLHDGIGQSLNLARIKLEAALVEAGAAANADAMARRLREITGIIDETNSAIRTLEFDLSPPVLRELGLTPALEWLAEDMRRAYGLQVGVSDDGEPEALGALSRAIAFRTVRELLINVVRHAGVMQAHVDVQRADDALIITVSDEGAGFDAKAVTGGLGLVSVRERLGYLRGAAKIDSAPGEGTVATLTIPLSEENTVGPLPEDRPRVSR